MISDYVGDFLFIRKKINFTDFTDFPLKMGKLMS